LDNPARFSATLYSAYLVALAPDKQTSAVQDTTVLQRRDYTKDGMTAPTPPRSSLLNFLTIFLFSSNFIPNSELTCSLGDIVIGIAGMLANSNQV
jgi:hypothetical protein